MERIDGGGPRLGACGSFAALLARSEADYVMFCDQDDVWLPEKIARTLGKMTAVEREAARTARCWSTPTWRSSTSRCVRCAFLLAVSALGTSAAGRRSTGCSCRTWRPDVP